MELINCEVTDFNVVFKLTAKAKFCKIVQERVKVKNGFKVPSVLELFVFSFLLLFYYTV